MRHSLLIFAALVMLACQRENADMSQNAPSESTTAVGSTTPSPDMMPPTVQPATAKQEVHLIEYQIHMPQTLPAGKVAFNVENAGKQEHGFEIEGNGIEQKTEKLKAGDTASLEVDLKPGTYTVYCPVADHKDKGMQLTVQVQ